MGSEKPLTEDRLREIEARIEAERLTVPPAGEPPLRTQIVNGDAPRLLAEVRRLRGLFSEEDARIVEAMLHRWDGLVPVYASDDDHHPVLRGATDEEYDRGDSLPARIRSVTGGS